MNENLYFCDHAVKRLKKRSKMSEKLAHKLASKDNTLVIHSQLGVKGMKEYRVFYSPVDNKFYVAVVGADSREVITILHSWQSREFRKVPKEDLEVIKQKAIAFESTYADKQINVKRKIIYVNLSYYKDDREFKTLPLFKVMAEEYNYDLEEVAHDRSVVIRIANELTCREIPIQWVNGIVLKLGNKGDPIYYDFDGTNLTKYEIVKRQETL